jgi:hypothetical protein
MLKMQKGVRDILKQRIPERYWPALRYADKHIINLLYVGYLLQRFFCKLRYFKIPKMVQQSLLTFSSKIPLDSNKTTDLSQALKASKISFEEGRHTIYLKRRSDIVKINDTLCKVYPHSFGLKIIKSQEISSDGTPYYTSYKLAPASNRISMHAVGSVKEKMVISNLLSMNLVAPRVYDLICLQSNRGKYFALIVQNINGKAVTGKGGLEFIGKLEALLHKMGIKVLGIKNHKDFRPPDFRNNIIADKSGTYYVDIQNFVMFDQSSIQKRISKVVPHRFESKNNDNASEKDLSYFQLFKEFFERNRLNLRQSNVLVDGYNSVAFTMFALSKGARWCVILDYHGMVEQTKSILYYYGFSRFDVVDCNRQEFKIDLLPVRKYDYGYFSSDEMLHNFPQWLETIDCQFLFYEVLDMARMDDIKKRLEELPLDCPIVGLRKEKKKLNPIMLLHLHGLNDIAQDQYDTSVLSL